MLFNENKKKQIRDVLTSTLNINTNLDVLKLNLQYSKLKVKAIAVFRSYGLYKYEYKDEKMQVMFGFENPDMRSSLCCP